MDLELESMLNRAVELLRDLEDEYKGCLQAQKVTERAKNLTHEVLEKLRNLLDHTMMRAWGIYVAPQIVRAGQKSVHIYFPIGSDLNSFRSILGRGGMADLDKVHKSLYDFLLKQQPFSSGENRWLYFLNEIVRKGKHVRLIPQKRTENRRITVSKPEVGSVSWTPDSVKFGPGVSIMEAPVDPRTQRIVPTPGVTEQVEIWVSFVLDGYGVNGLGFCKEACQKTRVLIEEMVNIFQL